jgi:hypothetical protein
MILIAGMLICASPVPIGTAGKLFADHTRTDPDRALDPVTNSSPSPKKPTALTMNGETLHSDS